MSSRGGTIAYVTLSETKAELQAVAASHGWNLDGIEIDELTPPGVLAEPRGNRAGAVLIADIGLPGEDGLSLMRRIRSASGPGGGIPAIALSAYTRVEDREAAYAAGFTDFVGKPAAQQDLLYAVQRVLD